MRKPNDAYYTSDALADAIVSQLWKHLPLYFGPAIPDECREGRAPRILEPSAGGGAFVRAARRWWSSIHITAVEPHNEDEALKTADVVYKRTIEEQCALHDGLRYTLALGNPPYNLAESHVNLVRRVSFYTAFLLRLSFLGSQRRASTIYKEPGLRYLLPLAQRPSFTSGGTDNSEYAVFVWEHGWTENATILPHIWVQP